MVDGNVLDTPPANLHYYKTTIDPIAFSEEFTFRPAVARARSRTGGGAEPENRRNTGNATAASSSASPPGARCGGVLLSTPVEPRFEGEEEGDHGGESKHSHGAEGGDGSRDDDDEEIEKTPRGGDKK